MPHTDGGGRLSHRCVPRIIIIIIIIRTTYFSLQTFHIQPHPPSTHFAVLKIIIKMNEVSRSEVVELVLDSFDDRKDPIFSLFFQPRPRFLRFTNKKYRRISETVIECFLSIRCIN